jgi:hypothetical protein
VMVLGQRKVRKLTCEALWTLSVGIECCHSSIIIDSYASSLQQDYQPYLCVASSLFIIRALLAAFLHGFPSLHFRKNFKKVKKSILQQLPFPYMFPMIATVLPNALGSTVHIPINCLF